ncbi:hypothetical protein IGJ16_002228 [Enterococcus pernyi]|uniref:Uncharacterized protein n=1 Tax=Enterococcus mundtii TaxID=53346 RepID=A0A2S7RUH3_ENTMU|nr:hypothetical protein [Enterococcus mundtii]OBS60859.1 hypothetical protein AX758_06805 [Enterococcus mundtii]PQF23419.1 hypothetical protein CUS89_07575 [Enterococcus mundtii]
MYHYLDILNFGILGLMLISLVSLILISNRIELFKQYIYSKKIFSAASDETEIYIRMLKKSNQYIFLTSISFILSNVLVSKNILNLSYFFLISGIFFLLLSLTTCFYSKESISQGYLVIAKNKSYLIYYFKNQKQQNLILSWQNKMISSLYLTLFFYMLLLISTLLMKTI